MLGEDFVQDSFDCSAGVQEACDRLGIPNPVD